MKKAELTFGALLVPIDYIMLVLAGLTAYSLRFQSPVTSLQPVLYEIPFQGYFIVVLITALVWLGIFAWAGLYSISSTRRLVEEARKVLLACSTGVLIIIILFFVNRDLFSSRFIILAAYGLSVVYVTFARVAVLYLQRYLFRKGYGVHNVALIGGGRLAEVISAELESKKSLGLSVRYEFDSFTDDVRHQILGAHERGELDEIIHTNPHLDKKQSEDINNFADENHIVFKYAAALFDTQSANVAIQPVAGIPIVEVKRTRLDGWGRIVKRLFDILASIILIILVSPVMLAAAIAILLDSGRPVLFTRNDDNSLVKRIGQYGKDFFYFKFRTMVPGTHEQRYNELADKDLRKDAPVVKIEDDPRITRAGRFLRRTSIDELPELFLVLKGDMSLVGPRPHLPEEVARYEAHHKRVLRIKPGITGLSQISGRSDLSFEDEVRLDTFYIENWALWLDVVILVKTPFILLKKRTAL